jgi:hypothetical protein
VAFRAGLLATSRHQSLAASAVGRNDVLVEPLISHRDVTTIVEMLGDIRADIAAIRGVLEEDNGEEEEGDPEANS